MNNVQPANEIRHFAVGGATFALFDPGGTVAAETIGEHAYEPAVTALLAETLRPGCTFLDVGALHGYFSCLVGALCPSSVVHAFEPNPEYFEVLEQNFRANGVRGFAHRVALSADASDLHFRGRRIVDASTPDAIVVRGMRFDDFADKAGFRDAVLKIDVHGAECLVMQGMRKSLRERVAHVFLEVHPKNLLVGPCDYQQLLVILEEAGFVVYEMDKFRQGGTPKLVPMVGAAREAFVEYDRWKPFHVSQQRMLYAKRSQSG